MASSSRKDSLFDTLLDGEYQKVMDDIKKKSVDINTQDSDGNTLLHFALTLGHTVLARFLLQENARTDLPNRLGKTAEVILLEQKEEKITPPKKILPLLKLQFPSTNKDDLTLEQTTRLRRSIEIWETKRTKERWGEIGWHYWELGELAKALHYLRKGANAKCTRAANFLADFYSDHPEMGKFPSDQARDQTILNLLKFAVKNNLPEGLANLGLFYLKRGNKSEALRLLTQAAETGNAIAQRNLASLIKSGDIVPDSKSAEHWYRESFRNGYISSGVWIAEIILKKSKENKKEALKLLLTAAKEKDGNAYLALGDLYNEDTALDKEKKLTNHYYHAAAKAGFINALFRLGSISKTPEEKNALLSRGFVNLYISSRQKEPKMQYEIGKCYLEGNGVLPDTHEGIKFLEKAAYQGYTPAYLQLGTVFAAISSERQQAKRWLQMAFDAGYEEAEDLLRNLLNKYSDLRDSIPEYHMPDLTAEPISPAIEAEISPETSLVEEDKKEEESKQELSEITKLKKIAEKGDPIAIHLVDKYLKERGGFNKAKNWRKRMASKAIMKGRIDMLPEKFAAAFPLLNDIARALHDINAEYYIKGSNVPYVIKKIIGLKPPQHPTRPGDIDLEINCVELEIDPDDIKNIFTRFGFTVTIQGNFINMEYLLDKRIKIQVTLITDPVYQLNDPFKPTQPRLKLHPDGQLDVIKLTSDNLENFFDEKFEIDVPYSDEKDNKRYTYFINRLIEGLDFYRKDKVHTNSGKIFYLEYLMHFLQKTHDRSRFDFYGEIAMLIKNNKLSHSVAKTALHAFSAVLFKEFKEKMLQNKLHDLLKLCTSDIFTEKLLQNLMGMSRPIDGMITSYIRYISTTVISTFNQFYSGLDEDQNTIFQTILTPCFTYLPPVNVVHQKRFLSVSTTVEDKKELKTEEKYNIAISPVIAMAEEIEKEHEAIPELVTQPLPQVVAIPATTETIQVIISREITSSAPISETKTATKQTSSTDQVFTRLHMKHIEDFSPDPENTKLIDLQVIKKQSCSCSNNICTHFFKGLIQTFFNKQTISSQNTIIPEPLRREFKS